LSKTSLPIQPEAKLGSARTLVTMRDSNYPHRLSPSCDVEMVGLGRLELPTSPLSGVRSSHLSYRPRVKLVELVGIEPATS
jgi:hypothetical protein